MLKKIVLRNKEIPVPIPIFTLEEVLQWIEKTFVKDTSIITRITLNEKDLPLDLTPERRKDVKFDEHSSLEIQVDSPKELSLQTVDAISELAYEIEKRLKIIAVDFWQLKTHEQIALFNQIQEDVTLILQLIDHVNGLLDRTHEDMAPINGISKLLKRVLNHIDSAKKQQDWKRVASILLNRLEPLLNDLVKACEALEINILTIDFRYSLEEPLRFG